MRISFTTLFLIILLNQIAIAGDSIPNINFFSADRIGNVYALQNDELIRIDAHGFVTGRFSKKDIGSPSFFDAHDPLRILVYYKNFGVLRILDKQLTEQTETNLHNNGIYDAAFIAGSADQGIWIYEQSMAQLIKLDRFLKRTTVSIDLRLFLGKDPDIQIMEVNDRWIALCAADQVLIFDQYGTLSRKIPLACKPIQFQLIEDKLYLGCSQATTVFSLRNAGFDPQTIPPPPAGAAKSILVGDQYYWLKDGWLHFH